MVPKTEKDELDKLDLHLSTQLPKIFPEVEDNTKLLMIKMMKK